MYYYFLYIALSIVVIPGLILGIYAQSKIHNAYKKGLELSSKKGIVAKDFARRVLDASGLENVNVVEVRGRLSDYYDPKNKVVALSHENYNSSSLAALGITAHEIGHALQHKTGYKPLKIRNIFIKITNFFSMALFPLLLLSTLISFFLAVWFSNGWDFNSITYIPIFVVIGLYGVTCLLNLITLFVEFNASKRTEMLLVETDLLDEDEYIEVKKILKAAALTYVASFVTSLLELIRLILLVVLIRDKRE